MTVFLTPDGEPFYGGTYFPKEDRYGMPGFRRVLLAVAQAYREKPDDVQKTVGQLRAGLQRMEALQPSGQALEAHLVAARLHLHLLRRCLDHLLRRHRLKLDWHPPALESCGIEQ